MKNSFYLRGFSVIEIIVASAIIATVITAAAGAWQLYIKTSATSTRQSQAALLTEESAEVLRIFRDQSWTNLIAPLSLNVPYQLSWTGTSYRATTAQVIIQGQFIRTITFSAVNRDSNDNIVNSGGTLDSNTRRIAISIFPVGATSTPIIQSEILLHNVFTN